MDTSGLILDLYDDVGGRQLKSHFSSLDGVPEVVKTARAVTSVERDRLPDDVFALVLVNDDEKLRKYACIDDGNTALNVFYFLENAHKLPAEAIVKTAQNLRVACGWYGLDVPEALEKLADSLDDLSANAESSLHAPPKIVGEDQLLRNQRKPPPLPPRSVRGVPAPGADRLSALDQAAESSIHGNAPSMLHRQPSVDDIIRRSGIENSAHPMVSVNGGMQAAEHAAAGHAGQLAHAAEGAVADHAGQAVHAVENAATHSPAALGAAGRFVGAMGGKAGLRGLAGGLAAGLAGGGLAVSAYNKNKPQQGKIVTASEQEKVALIGRLMGSAAQGAGNMVINKVKKDPIGALGTAATISTIPNVATGTARKIKGNLMAINAAEDAHGIGGGLLEAGHSSGKIAQADIDWALLNQAFKGAELTGTSIMPTSKVPETSKSTKNPAGTIKTAAAVRGASDLVREAPAGAMPSSLPQHMNPIVHATGKQPVHTKKEKKASYYAMPSEERYPIDTFEQVKQASVYFNEYHRMMEPEDRREYSANLLARASDLNVKMPDLIHQYGSTKYASDHGVSMALESRLQYLEPEDQQILNKLASIRASMQPDEFANALSDFDHYAGLQNVYGSHIPDAFMSTFGILKTAASDSDEDHNWSEMVAGQFLVTSDALKSFALRHRKSLLKLFAEDMVDEFQKEPVAIFKSLPLEQKKIVAKMTAEDLTSH